MTTHFKNNLKVGHFIKFFRTHDKATPLTGTIVRVHDGDDDLVDVKTEAGNGSVSRIETAHAADVTILKEAAGHAPAETKTEGKPLFR